MLNAKRRKKKSLFNCAHIHLSDFLFVFANSGWAKSRLVGLPDILNTGPVDALIGTLLPFGSANCCCRVFWGWRRHDCLGEFHPAVEAERISSFRPSASGHECRVASSGIGSCHTA